MLSKEENEMLTRVGPGTPCGELMRRYRGDQPHAIYLRGSTLRTTWTATAPTGNSFSSCTRRPIG